jgi:hypothetical protein
MLESRPRPLSELSGRRHVPILVSGNGTPYLRIKKPQSPFLSRIIRDKALARQKKVDKIEELGERMSWADDEDEWNELIGSQEDNGRPWREDMNIVQKKVERKWEKSDAERIETARRMFEIVLEERRLFKEERESRRQA